MNTKLVKELKKLRKEIKRLRKATEPKPRPTPEDLGILPNWC